MPGFAQCNFFGPDRLPSPEARLHSPGQVLELLGAHGLPIEAHLELIRIHLELDSRRPQEVRGLDDLRSSIISRLVNSWVDPARSTLALEKCIVYTADPDEMANEGSFPSLDNHHPCLGVVVP